MCVASSVFWSPPTPILPASVGCPRCVSFWRCSCSAAAQRYDSQPLPLLHTHTDWKCVHSVLNTADCCWEFAASKQEMVFPLFLQVSSANSLERVKEKWSSYRNQCLDNLTAAPPATGEHATKHRIYSGSEKKWISTDRVLLFTTGLVCNRTFDLYACWPDGLPGTTVNVSCPWFLPWYNQGLYVCVCRECIC